MDVYGGKRIKEYGKVADFRHWAHHWNIVGQSIPVLYYTVSIEVRC